MEALFDLFRLAWRTFSSAIFFGAAAPPVRRRQIFWLASKLASFVVVVVVAKLLGGSVRARVVIQNRLRQSEDDRAPAANRLAPLIILRPFVSDKPSSSSTLLGLEPRGDTHSMIAQTRHTNKRREEKKIG